MSMLFDVSMDLRETKAYKRVLKHRKKCPKWSKEFCLECFGGGLSRFLEDVLPEIEKHV